MLMFIVIINRYEITSSMGQLHVFKASLRINLSRANITNMVCLSSMNLLVGVYFSSCVNRLSHTV